jgi:hypothetical protein
LSGYARPKEFVGRPELSFDGSWEIFLQVNFSTLPRFPPIDQ